MTLLRFANYGLIGLVVSAMVTHASELIPGLRLVVYLGLVIYATYFLSICLAISQAKRLNPITAKHLGIALAIGILTIGGALSEGTRLGSIARFSHPQNQSR